jgi:hypothetical protein
MVSTGCSQKSDIPLEQENSKIAETNPESAKAQNTYGALSIDSQKELTIEEMLTYAIQDEYLARAEYKYVSEELGATRPFTNIIKAEEEHIAALKPLFDEMNLEVPEDKAAEYLIKPASESEALEIGVEAEIKNIAMYEEFLKKSLPDEVRIVFEELKRGSENHLKAFRQDRGR